MEWCAVDEDFNSTKPKVRRGVGGVTNIFLRVSFVFFFIFFILNIHIHFMNWRGII